MSVQLRPYQEVNFEQLREQLKVFRSVIYCLPCGGGKGTVISQMVRNAVAKDKSVIFVVRGLALVNDMSRRLTRLGLQHGVLRGGRRREHWHAVQVASIDTLFRMQNKPHADLVIIDEARTFMSDTGLQAVSAYPDAKIVGMDATPSRLDGKGLGVVSGGIFESIVNGPNEQELIDLGFLVPSLVVGTGTVPDVSKVQKTGGDFNNKKLAEVCDKVKLVGDIVDNWMQHAKGLKTLAFGVDQAHAKHIQEKFLEAGIEWEYVDANTPDDQREAIYSRFDNGSLTGISNVMIAGCGWDHPVVSCIIAARPTASLPLWRQMIGRGSRIYPGKKRFIILDHAGNTVRHFPHGFFETPPLWTLMGPAPVPKDGEGRPQPISMCKRPVPVPKEGVPATFTGPVSADGRFMLPSFHYFPTGPEACPECGLPLRGPGRSIETEAGQLVDLSELLKKAKAETKVLSQKQVKFEEELKARYLELARITASTLTRKGVPYKPGYASIQFHAETNRWPKKEWKEQAAMMKAERAVVESLI